MKSVAMRGGKRRGFVVALALCTAAGSASAATAPAAFPTVDGAEWVAVACANGSATESSTDEPDNAIDLVGDATRPAAALQSVGDHLFVRLRLDASPLGGAFPDFAGGHSYIVAFDDDAPLDASDYEHMAALTSAVGGGEELVWAENTDGQGATAPANDAETALETLAVADFVRVDATTDVSFGPQDYWLTLALPWTDPDDAVVTLEDEGLARTAPVHLWIATGDGARAMTGDLVCAAGAATALADVASAPVVLDPNGDPDADGVANNSDNCPDDGNGGQEDGDGDGIGDACDACEADADNDADGDGVCGDSDNCPGDANDTQADGDGDDVGDACDNCAEVENPEQRDAWGSPDTGDACEDTDADGLVDAEEDADGNGVVGDGETDPTVADSDGDGVDDGAERTATTDPTDADSDADGLGDGDEIGDAADPTDTDGDGVIDALDDDDDGDDIPTAEEIAAAGGDTDRDGDGTVDWLDDDADGDGIGDVDEGGGDADEDGTPNHLDLDADGDGIDDADEGSEDLDGDGVGNFLDPDSDGDSFKDRDEGAGDLDGDGVPDYADTDADGDGEPDRAEGIADQDGDGIPDHLDGEVSGLEAGGGGGLGATCVSSTPADMWAIGAIALFVRRRRRRR